MPQINRRSFLKKSAAAGAVAVVGCAAQEKRSSPAVAAPRRGPNEELRVACIGFHGQGRGHVARHTKAKNVRVATLCDVDENQWAAALKIVEDCHHSSALCHLANIAYRLGRTLDFDPKTERFKGDAEANAMLTRNYRAPFVVPTNV